MLSSRIFIRKFSTLIKQDGTGFNFRVSCHKNDKQLSFWHDLDYRTDKKDEVNVIMEIPR
jgi:hypothetical protein